MSAMQPNKNMLCIDIGNTNIHLGLWDGSQWKVSWRARTVSDKMSDEYAVLLRNFLASTNLTFESIGEVAIGSVVPALTTTFVELSQRYMEIDPLVITSKTNTGIRIEIDQPEQAGADRIINAAAVVKLYGGPALVVDFGTATTFDVVSRNGAYKGGAISPGIGIAHDALVSRAAQLHKVNLTPPPSPIGSNTIHAMQSGIFWGYVGLVEGLVRRIVREMNEPDVKVIATGGLAPLFNEHTDVIHFIAPELTLEGLRIIQEINRQ